jgi:hypothetical protein
MVNSRIILLVAAVLAANPLALNAEPSDRWRIQFDHSALNNGVLVLRISPLGRAAIEVNTKIPERTSENRAARLLRDALRAALGEGYDVATVDGENVVIAKLGDTPDFDVSLVRSSVSGLSIELERQEPQVLNAKQ